MMRGGGWSAGLRETGLCSAAMLAGFGVDALNLPLSPGLCGGATGPLEAMRLHVTLFPIMHLTMGLALAMVWARNELGDRPRLARACARGLTTFALVFAGMHMGAAAAGWLRLDQGWWPMLVLMMLGMHVGSCVEHWAAALLRARQAALNAMDLRRFSRISIAWRGGTMGVPTRPTAATPTLEEAGEPLRPGWRYGVGSGASRMRTG